MKVYLVYQNNWDSVILVGTYSTKELAQEFIDRFGQKVYEHFDMDSFYFLEVEMDDSPTAMAMVLLDDVGKNMDILGYHSLIFVAPNDKGDSIKKADSGGYYIFLEKVKSLEDIKTRSEQLYQDLVKDLENAQ